MAGSIATARYMLGRRGYGVMMPLRTDTGRYQRVLVHMGWVPTERVAEYLRDVAHKPRRTVQGRLHITSSNRMQRPAGEMLGRPTWLRAHADAIAERVANMEPRVMLQAGEMATGKPIRINKIPLDGYVHPIRMQPSKHVEYAMTWYGLAVTLICVWFALALRKVPIGATAVTARPVDSAAESAADSEVDVPAESPVESRIES